MTPRARCVNVVGGGGKETKALRCELGWVGRYYEMMDSRYNFSCRLQTMEDFIQLDCSNANAGC